MNININGTEYELQKVPPRQWFRMRERTKNKNGLPIEEKLYSEILEHIVVSPKVTLDDFEEVEDIEELMKEAIEFQSKRKNEQ